MIVCAHLSFECDVPDPVHVCSRTGVGGVCSVLVGHPFDLVKVRMQTASAKDKKGSKGTFATLLDIVKTEGIGGLYRGVSAPLVAVVRDIWLAACLVVDA